MKSCLALFSILLAFCLPTCATANMDEHADGTFGNDDKGEYNVLMNARGNELSAICMTNREADGGVVGTLMNEFGMKILDFTFNGGKAKVMNVFAPMNKWYIRKVLNKDLAFIFSNINKNENVTKRKRRMEVRPNGDVVVSNDRFRIYYTFSKTKIGQ